MTVLIESRENFNRAKNAKSRSFWVTDMNGNGNPDIITNPLRKNDEKYSLVIYWNNGQGEFTKFTRDNLGAFPTSHKRLIQGVAQITGDKKAEILYETDKQLHYFVNSIPRGQKPDSGGIDSVDDSGDGDNGNDDGNDNGDGGDNNGDDGSGTTYNEVHCYDDSVAGFETCIVYKAGTYFSATEYAGLVSACEGGGSSVVSSCAGARGDWFGKCSGDEPGFNGVSSTDSFYTIDAESTCNIQGDTWSEF